MTLALLLKKLGGAESLQTTGRRRKMEVGNLHEMRFADIDIPFAPAIESGICLHVPSRLAFAILIATF